MLINPQPKFCAIFFAKINSDAHASTKINTFTFYMGVWGAIAPKAKEMKKEMEAFPFLHQILHTRRVDSPVLNDVVSESCLGSGGGGGHAPPNLLALLS